MTVLDINNTHKTNPSLILLGLSLSGERHAAESSASKTGCITAQWGCLLDQSKKTPAASWCLRKT